MHVLTTPVAVNKTIKWNDEGRDHIVHWYSTSLSAKNVSIGTGKSFEERGFAERG